MSDESAYSHARGEINRRPCVFDCALIERQAVCELAVEVTKKSTVAVVCAQPLARAVCAQMSALLREKSSFSLKQKDATSKLSQAEVMQLQCGGLNGLKAVVDTDAIAPDVHRLMRLAQDQYGDLADLPFSEIVKGISAWKATGRKRGALVKR